MSTEQIFATGRVLERLMICGFAGLCLTFGWNLFRVGVLNEQSAELSAKGWRVNLKRVGPGAFFALFGCAVLSISLRSPLALPLASVPSNLSAKISPEKVHDGEGKEQANVVYFESHDSEIVKRWVADLNTILHVATPDKFPNATEKKILSRTNEDLETLRNALVIRQFGASLFRDYNLYRKRIRDDGAPGSPEEQEKFAQIDDWMQGNRIQE
jgi:hypothetical protein